MFSSDSPVCSITGEYLIDELERMFTAAGGPPMVLRMNNGSRRLLFPAAWVSVETVTQ